MKGLKGFLVVALAVSLWGCKGSGGSGDSGQSFNLEPLKPFTGVSDWTTQGGGPAHSGYVAVTLNPADFTPRWSVDLPPRSTAGCGETFAFTCVYLSGAVTDSANGHVILTTDSVSQTADSDTNDITLLSLDEKDGSVAWSVTGFPLSSDSLDTDEFSAPAIGAGRVYFSYYVNSPFSPTSPALEAFDAKTGAKTFLVNPPCASPCGDAYKVTGLAVSGSFVYAGDPVSAYDAGDGALLWTAAGGGSDPSADPQAVYYALDEDSTANTALVTLDAASGSSLFQVTGAHESGEVTAPVLDGMDGAVVGRLGIAYLFQGTVHRTGGFLDHYALTTHVQDWQVTGDFAHFSKPVTAKGIVYICNGKALDAYAVSDGILQWSWKPANDTTLQDDGAGGGNCSLAVTNNVLFVSSSQATYAVGLSDHTSKWSYPAGGRLAISPSGLLYISVNAHGDTPGHLVAINLH